jgi:hypothetical protein
VDAGSSDSGEKAVAVCCFCTLRIRLTEDPRAMEVRLFPLDGGKGRQTLYTHSSCLRERLDPSIDLWWE